MFTYIMCSVREDIAVEMRIRPILGTLLNTTVVYYAVTLQCSIVLSHRVLLPCAAESFAMIDSDSNRQAKQGFPEYCHKLLTFLLGHRRSECMW